jgi:nitrogen regulatory protein PII
MLISMKIIWAIIQSRSLQKVIDALENVSVQALTCMEVTGYNKKTPIPREPHGYAELPKEMLMIVLADQEVAKAVIAIRTAVKSILKDYPDAKNPENGKIFVTYVEDYYTIRIVRKNAEIPGA